MQKEKIKVQNSTEARNDGNTVLPAVFSHPTDAESGRYLCNAEHPMPKQRPEKSRWTHPDAKCIDEDYGKGGGVADGDYEKYECPHCKHKWWVELPN